MWTYPHWPIGLKGTVIDDAGITVGNTTSWIGRALAFGGTVTTDTDTINSTCTTGATVAAASGTRREGTINVVKTVINDNGGTKTIADFPLFVNGTLVTSGVSNTFRAPASIYSITEVSDSNYVQSFSGDCDLSGNVNLNPGDNKFCIITNDDIGPSLPVPPVPPLIDVVKVPSPLALPGGPGPVTYAYTLRNMGTVPVTNITMVGDTCSPIVLSSGDTNGDAKLDVNETWIHHCTTNLSQTHTNTVVATGWANGISAVDIASASVVVGLPIVPPLIHVTKIPNPLTAFGGGYVNYAYTVTNPGIAALHNIILTDDKCGPIFGPFGDANGNRLLESNEIWAYACRVNLTKSTTNTAVVTGEANGLIVRDFAIATVLTTSPGFPNTGYTPQDKSALWDILIALTALGAFFYVLRKKQGA